MRHGEAENNAHHILAGRNMGYHLTERGKVQVGGVAEKLKTISIDAMYTSPITRAMETSQIVSEKVGINYATDDRLTETDMGSLTGIGYNEVLERYGNLFLKFYQDDNDDVLSEMRIERFSSVGVRISSMLDYVAENHPDKNVLLVTHLDPIKAAVKQIMDLKAEVLFKMVIRNASLTILKHSSRDYTLSALNVIDVSRYALE